MKTEQRLNMSDHDLFAGFDPDDQQLLTMDGYDSCILGVMERFGMEPIVCYDKNKVIEQLMGDDEENMTHEEAVEFFEFNQIGAWCGDRTPCFLSINEMTAAVQSPSEGQGDAPKEIAGQTQKSQ